MNFQIDFNKREAIDISQLNADPSLDWLIPLKQKAVEYFKSNNLPGRKVEHWKYNDLHFLQTENFSLTQNTSAEKSADLKEQIPSIDFASPIEVIFVNGVLSSCVDSIQSNLGLKVTKFSQANESQRKVILSLIDPNYSQKNLFSNLNELLFDDGILIEVEANTIVEQPVYLRYLSSSTQSSSLSSNQVVVSLGQSSQLNLIEQFDSEHQQQSTPFALQQTQIQLAANSQLNHYRINLERESAKQVSQVKTLLSRDSILNSFYFGFGSRLNRTDVDVIHNGENAQANLTGIYLPSKSEAIDYHTNIEHRVPHCNSKEVFRGLVADQSSATFNGKIHIFQDAQKSDAYLNNKNLLLTNQAEINTKPELEIYADDVVCAHGATVAQLDKKALYYMQSRGIDYHQAKKTLSLAFVQELLNQIKLSPVSNFLSSKLDQHMSKIDE